MRRHEHNGGIGSDLSRLPQQLHAVNRLHLEIEKGKLIGALLDGIERLERVRERINGKACILQTNPGCIQNVCFIVNQNNGRPREIRCHACTFEG
jgi:hypothetical protein